MSNVVARLTLPEQTNENIRRTLASQGSVRSARLFVGLVVIASIAYADRGNFATNIQAGATSRYGLLCAVILINVITMLFQALAAKLGIVTGPKLAELCRDHLSRLTALETLAVRQQRTHPL